MSWTRAAIGLFLLCVIAVGAWLAFVREGPVPDPAIEAHREYAALVERIATGDDAAPLYAHAAQVRDRIDAAEKTDQNRRVFLGFSMDRLLGGAWDDPELDEDKRVWEAHAETVAAFVEASRSGSWRAPVDAAHQDLPARERSQVLDVLLEMGFATIRTAVHVHMVRMRAAHEAGDAAETLRAAEDALRVLEQHAAPSFLSLNISIGVELNLLRHVRNLAMEGLDARAAEALIMMLRAHWEESPERLVAHIEGERILTHDSLWSVRFHATREEREEWEDSAIFWNSALSERELRDYGRWLGSFRYEMVWPEIDAYHAALYANFTATPLRPSIEPDHAEYPHLRPILRVTGPVVQNTMGLLAQLHTERAATIAALRLAAYNDRHGAWPAVLSDAAPDEETLDPVTGRAFVYSVVEEESGPRPSLLAPGDRADYGMTSTLLGDPEAQFRWWREMLRPRRPIDGWPDSELGI